MPTAIYYPVVFSDIVLGSFAINVLFCFLSADVVAFDFLGHGDSPAPNVPALYTANEVRYIISILYVVILTIINTYDYTCIFDIHSTYSNNLYRIPVFYTKGGVP